MWMPRRAFQAAVAGMQRPEVGVYLDCSGTVRKLVQLEQSRAGAGADSVGSQRPYGFRFSCEWGCACYLWGPWQECKWRLRYHVFK